MQELKNNPYNNIKWIALAKDEHGEIVEKETKRGIFYLQRRIPSMGNINTTV